MVRKSKTFEQLNAMLYMRSSQEVAIAELVKNHKDRVGELISELGQASSAKKRALLRIIDALPKESAPHLAVLAQDADPSKSYEACKILERLGSDGVDGAVIMMANSDIRIATRGIEIIHRIGEDALPRLRAVEPKSQAIIATIIELDPSALELLEDPMEAMLSSSDHNVSKLAISAAAKAGERALPLLQRLISSEDAFPQQNATNALIAIGAPIVDELIDMLDHPNGIVQQNSVRALKEIGSDAVPALNEAVDSSSQLIAQNAALVLRSLSKQKSTRSNSKSRGGLLGAFRKDRS